MYFGNRSGPSQLLNKSNVDILFLKNLKSLLIYNQPRAEIVEENRRLHKNILSEDLENIKQKMELKQIREEKVRNDLEKKRIDSWEKKKHITDQRILRSKIT